MVVYSSGDLRYRKVVRIDKPDKNDAAILERMGFRVLNASEYSNIVEKARRDYMK